MMVSTRTKRVKGLNRCRNLQVEKFKDNVTTATRIMQIAQITFGWLLIQRHIETFNITVNFRFSEDNLKMQVAV